MGIVVENTFKLDVAAGKNEVDERYSKTASERASLANIWTALNMKHDYSQFIISLYHNRIHIRPYANE